MKFQSDVSPDRRKSVVSQGYSEHLKTYCGMGSDLLTSDWNLWTVVGEFTTAHTDCKCELRVRGYRQLY
jgi:hypothetical protein